jgi:hypothetical protein
MDKTESMRRSLMHEVAHHMEWLMPDVQHAINSAWAHPARKPITGYAVRRREYFAESLVAYHVERDAIVSHDPVDARMVEQAITLMRQRR